MTIFSKTGGTFNHNSGTLKFNSWFYLNNNSSSHTINLNNTSLSLNNLTYSGGNTGPITSRMLTYTLGASDTFIVGGNLILEGDTTSDANAKVQANNGTIQVSGDVTVNAGFKGGTTALTLSGGSAQTLTLNTAILPSGNLTISKTAGTATISGTGTLNDINVTNGTLDFSPGTYTFVAGKTLTVATGKTLKFTGTDLSNKVTLRSSINGTPWNLANASGSIVSPIFVDVKDSNASNNIMAPSSYDSGGNTHWIITGSLSSASVVPATLLAGIKDNVTVSFTNQNPIPADGKIIITFPAGFTFETPAVYSATGIDGTFSVGVALQVLTITRSNNGTSSGSGAKTIVLTNIKNPTSSGTTGDYSLQTQNASSSALDSATVTGSIILPGATSRLTLSTPDDITAGGARANYTLTRYDQFNNLITTSAETFYLYTTSIGANSGFYLASSGGSKVTSITLGVGSSSGAFYYYDEKAGAYTITASDNASSPDGSTGITDATDALNVKHDSPDHLKFTTTITPPSKAGAAFILPPIQAVDRFNNVADNSYGATAYSGAKTLSYTLSTGLVNAPNSTVNDSWTTNVTFDTNGTGTSTTTLNTTLYRAQAASITPSDSNLTGSNIASEVITVNPDIAVQLSFAQQPTASVLTNSIFATQPAVAIKDTYGNQTADAYDIRIFASSTTGSHPYDFTATTGTLSSSHTNNTLAATAGLAEFSGVQYDSPATIYLYAESPGHSNFLPAFSSAVVVATAQTTTVEVSSSAVSNFNLIPTNDNVLGNPFSVIGFKLSDKGIDGKHTLIDQIKIPVGGTGVHAANDIAGASLYKVIDSVKTKVADASAISNSYITFGLTTGADNNSAAALYDLDNAASMDFVVDIYMKPEKLLATDHQTYTFGINESNIAVDGLQSSGMAANSVPGVSTVIGTIKVDISKIEIVTSAGNASATISAGSPLGALVRATDANKNIDLDYTGTHTLIFSGLGNVGTNYPKIKLNNNPILFDFGYNVTLSFNDDGTNGNGAVAMLIYPYKKEAPPTASVVAQEVGSSYGQFGLALTVDAGAPSRITSLSGNNQSISTGSQLQPFVAFVSDTYGNPAGGSETSVNFAINAQPSGAGASLSRASDYPGRNGTAGQVTTTMTLGSIAGAYQVTATESELTGSPLSFNATALAPGSIQIISGDAQSAQVASTLVTELRIKSMDTSTPPVAILNQPVTFTITSYPTGASGYRLGPTPGIYQVNAVTDANGAATTLTLGQKAGPYKVTVSSLGVTSIEFTATAVAKPASKVAFIAPLVTSVNAGIISDEFKIATQDEYSNNSSLASTFSLASSSATGHFYANSAGTGGYISSVSIASGSTTASFWYKDLVTGSANITVNQTSGQALTNPSAVQAISIMPGNAYRLTVTGTDTATAHDTISTGGTKAITITLYDDQGNKMTNYTNNNLGIIFSGANVSPAASGSVAGTAPTCLDKSGNSIPFGTSTPLAFSSGVATTTATLYKAESVLIKATSGSLTTVDIDALSFIVKHGQANHLKFSGNLPSAVTAGQEFSFGANLALHGVDLYNNICNGDNGGPAFSGDKGISWAINGTHNGPEGNVSDYFVLPGADYGPTTISFINGVSQTALKAKLFYAQTIVITASCADLQGTNIASNPITVGSGMAAKLRFTRQPSASCITSQPLAVQPIVAVSDQYGNPVSGSASTVSLSAYLNTNTPPTAATHTLSGSGGLSKSAVDGVATFSGVTYNYPESIFLMATVSGFDSAFSSQISFATAQEATVASGLMAKPTQISSLANASAAAVNIFDFIISDTGNDGFTTKVNKVVIKRDTATDTTPGWSTYLSGVSITDNASGSVPIPGVIENNQITFDFLSYTITNGGEKTFTVNIYLVSPLPLGADGKVLSFKIDPSVDITLEALGSRLGTYTNITSSPEISVVATNFIITGPSTMNAGVPRTITLKAVDIVGNIDKDFSGGKALTFSGANASLKGNLPTAASYVPTDIAFGTPTPVSFTDSQCITSIKLYNAETAVIKAAGAGLTTSNSNALTIAVSGGSATSLAWSTQPVAVTVENAPWQAFSIALVDAYGNTSPGTAQITVAPSAGDVTNALGAVATAQSGIATFYNFAVNGVNDGGKITLSAVADDNQIAASAASNEVQVFKLYNITLHVKDYTSGTDLTECTLDATQNGVTVPDFLRSGNSPFTFSLPYGTYTFTVSKAQYVDQNEAKTVGVAADYIDGTYDAKIDWTMTATSLVEATSDYNVKSAFVYDESTDKLSIRAWLERRGLIITGDSVNKLGTASVQIYNDSVSPPVWFTPIVMTTANSGVYNIVEDKVVAGGGIGVQLTSGRTYYAKVVINYGGSAGTSRAYEGGTTFSVTVNESLKTITSAIQTVTTGIAGQTAEIKTVVKDEIQKQVEEVIVPKITDVKTETSAILAATGTESLQTKIDTVKSAVVNEVQPHVISGILNSETSVKQGAKMTIRYRTTTGLTPVLNVYSPKDVLLLSNKPMIEIGATGIYEYSVTFSAAWGLGSFTVICSEPTKGTVDALVMTVIQSNLEDVSGQVSAVLGSTSGISGLKNVTDTIGSQFSDMDKLLTKISKDVAGKLGDAKAVVNDLAGAFKQLEEMSKQIKDIGGTTGVNLEKLYEVSKDKKEDITYIKNKSEELKAAMEINQKMIENVAKKPVVQTWFEFK